jgi:peptide/nickel transport system substrate-binding protein
VLEKHEDYWKGPAEIDRVIRQVLADNNTAIQMLGQGDVDIIQINKSEVAQVKGVTGIEVVEDIPIDQLIKINFNFDIQGDRFIGNGEMGSSGTPANIFSDIDVRKGFSYAFDYEVFVEEVLLGAGITPYGPVLVGFPTANPDNPQYYLSLEKAEEHLRLAFDGQLWEKGFKLTVPYNEGSEPRQRALEILQTNLRAINPKFELELTSLPWAAYVAAINDKEMPLSIFGILPTYRHPYAALHYHMHSTGYYAPVEGYVELAQEKYDDLIEELGSTFDENRMEEISHLLQQYSYDDALSIFHHQAIGQIALREWINGYEITRAPFLINYYKISKG